MSALKKDSEATSTDPFAISYGTHIYTYIHTCMQYA